MTYSSTILGDSPTAFYQMHETSGTSIADSSGNGYNGTLHGTVTLNQTAILQALGVCMLFDGSTGYISLPNGARQQNPVTFEGWLSMPASLQFGYLFGATTAAVGLAYDSTNNTFYAAGNSNHADMGSALTSTAGTVYYVCMTIDASMNFSGYYAKSTDSDVTAFGSVNPGGASIAYGANTLDIGQRGDAGAYWNSYLSNLAIYPAVLTHAQAKAHFLAGLVATSTRTISSVTAALSTPPSNVDTSLGIGMSNEGVGNDDAVGYIAPDDAMFYLYQVGLTSRGGYMPPPRPRKIKKG
jgi:hypothetical protein